MKPAGGNRSAPQGNIESVAAATIVGWAIADGRHPVDVQVRVGTIPVRTTVRRVDRPDVRAAHPGSRSVPDGFAVELDSGAWSMIGADGVLPVVVCLNGVEFRLPRPLDRSILAEWWRNLAALPPDESRERRMLRFLMHAVSAGGPGALPPDVAQEVGHELAIRGIAAAPGEFDLPQRLARAARQQARLEAFDGLLFCGWAADPAVEPQAFRVVANGVALDCSAERTARPDVQQALGLAASPFGFRVELPPAVWSAADAQGRCTLDLYVEGSRVNAAPLEIDPGTVRRAASALDAGATGLRRLALVERHAEALFEAGLFGAGDRADVAARLAALDPEGRRHDPASTSPDAPPQAGAPRAVLESFDDLVLAGWAVDAIEGGEVFRLACNGRDVDCQVLRTHRGDVRAALELPLASEFLGFEIQVPAGIWRHADAEGTCVLQLRVNDRPLPFAPIRVDRATLARTAQERFGARGGRPPLGAHPAAVRARILRTLLAEHVVAAGIVDRLDDAARAGVHESAAWIEAMQNGGLDDGDDARRERQLQRRVWRLQRRLNVLLAREDAADALDDILSDVDATGPVREQLLLSLVPLMCDDPRAIDRIEHELPLDVQAWYAANGDNWQRSIFLVGLVRCGRFVKACATLERIVAAPGQGWLNTDCLRFVVRAALRPPTGSGTDAEGEGPARRRLVELFIDLVDALPGGYWSRRHDRFLVETLAELVVARSALPDALAARCRDAALRHYGLVPGFWERVDALDGAHDPALDRAREDARQVRAVFDRFADTRELPGAWREAAERLRLQQADGRRDAAQCLRELMLADIAAARGAGADEDVSWRFMWEGASPHDGRRADEHPLPRPGRPLATHASLWPTTDAPVAPGAGPENRLDLRSPPARVAALADAPVLVVCVVRNERVMLPHFLAHYRRLGARHFVFVDNGSDDGTPDYLLAQPDVVLYSADTDYRDSHYGVAWQQAVLAAHGLGRWAVVADADELLLYRDHENLSLPGLVGRLGAAGHDAAPVLMLDMYPRGPLRDTDFARSGPEAAAWFDRDPLVRWRLGRGLYSNSPTWLSAVRHRLIPHSPPNAFMAQKIALLRYKPWVRLSEGLHYASGLSPATEPLFFGHYKYHAGFRDKVLLEIERKQHYDGASEYAQYLAMVAEPEASLFAPEVSIELVDSRSLPAMDSAPAAAASPVAAPVR